MVDPLVKRIVVGKSSSSGNSLKEVSSCPVEIEDLLSVETQIFPRSEYSACIARERLHVGYLALCSYLLAVRINGPCDLAIPRSRIVDEKALVLDSQSRLGIEVIFLYAPHNDRRVIHAGFNIISQVEVCSSCNNVDTVLVAEI